MEETISEKHITDDEWKEKYSKDFINLSLMNKNEKENTSLTKMKIQSIAGELIKDEPLEWINLHYISEFIKSPLFLNHLKNNINDEQMYHEIINPYLIKRRKDWIGEEGEFKFEIPKGEIERLIKIMNNPLQSLFLINDISDFFWKM